MRGEPRPRSCRSVKRFCRLHVPSELVTVWRPDADGRTAHGNPNYRGAHSTADCRSNVPCTDGGTNEYGDLYQETNDLAYAPTNPQPQPGAQPGANVYAHLWCTRGPESVRQRNHG